MPLVLTTRRADWQRRQPCRAGRERAVSSGGASGGSGPASRTGLCREPVPAAPGLGRLASLRAPGRVRAPVPQPLPWRAEGGAAAAAESTAQGVRGKLSPRQKQGPVRGGAPSHGGAVRQPAAESQVPGPAAERRSPRPERAGKHRGCREPDERLDAVAGSSCPRRTASTVSRGLPQSFGSDCPLSLPLPHPLPLPRGLPLRALRLGPLLLPSLPPFLLSASPSFPPSLPSSHSGLLSLAHTFFLTHARRHILPLRALSLRLPLSLFLFHFCMPCNLLKCCPFPVIRQTPRGGPPRARPLPLSPAFCLSRSRSPPPICYTEAPVNGLH